MNTTAQSYLAGLIGAGVTPSLTPVLHEAEADHHGLRCIYRAVDLTVLGREPSDVGDLLRTGRDLGFNAFNVTHPCKQIVLGHLDEVGERAATLGAVNTVLIRGRRLCGYNTDVTGFGWALAHGLRGPDLTRVAQFGTGGAGAAVSYALLEAGVERLDLLDLDPARAADQVQRLSAHFPGAHIEAHPVEMALDLVPAATGIVNATPIGMADHPGSALDLDLLHAGQWVADIVYRPLQTELIVGARERGCAVLDGGWMAVGQAVDAFELMTGRSADSERMRAHFLQLVAQDR